MSAPDMQKREELSPTVAIDAYRVEWRHDLTGHWLLLESFNSLAEAQHRMEASVVDYGGQARCVGQRVVLADGICSHTTGRPA